MKTTTLKYKKLDYILSVPDDFSEDRKYPLIVFLHGAGGRGTDINMICSNPYFEITSKYEFDAVTFAPQCYANSWFDIFEALQDFIKFAVSHKFIMTEKVYLVGASMGGYATWQMAMTMPHLFAAIVPICGGGMYWNAGRLKNIKIWAYHGSEDETVFVEESVKMVDAVNAAGGDARLTVCNGVGHNSWINAYNSKELFQWLFAQTNNHEVCEVKGFDNQELFG